MAIHSKLKGQLVSYLYLFSCLVSLSLAATPNRFQIRAVGLGGWLVTEGWIKPSLFDGIPNKDLLDGTQVQFRSVKNGKYLCAEDGGGSIIVANRASALDWETFRLWRINENTFNLRVFNKQFMGLDARIVAVAKTPGRLETFQIVKESVGSNRVRIKAPNGFFLQVKTEELVTADSGSNSGWGDDDPSVFEMKAAATMHGEFQVTNGYGPGMREHWNTFVVEEDFKFISKNGLNAVRIPVGWWTARDPTPPKPYVGGSLKVLDKAFIWAQKYRLKVIIDLHAAPGSQNGYEHSGSRDGFQEWGEDYIKETVAVIDFLTARYCKSPSLVAVELMNEPRYPGVCLESLDTLIRYYRAGYFAVKKHSPAAYVVMSSRLGEMDAMELFPLASGLKGTVIDVHYYNYFSGFFKDMTVQQNIDYVLKTRSSQLTRLTASNMNGPLIFVGEWTAEWEVKDASKEDYQRFAKAELEVFGRATFGWSYWTFKTVQNHWSLQWNINNGYVKL